MFTLEINDKLEATLKVVLEGEELKKEEEKVLEKYKNAKVDGFRKGHVPNDVLKKTFENQIKEDLFNVVLQDAYTKALAEKNVEPIGNAEVVSNTLTAEKLEVVMKFSVKPEFELPQYKGLDVKVELPEVTDEMVEDAVKNTANRLRTLEKIEDRTVAELKDIANINFEGFIDGVAFEGGKADNFDLELGSGQFIAGFEEQIVGKNVDEEFEVNVVFPEEYHVESLKAKPAVFKVKLNAIKKSVVPAVDEDLAKKQGYETLEAFKNAVRENLEAQRQARLEDMKYQAIADKLVEATNMQLPADIVEAEKQNQLNELNQQLAQQGQTLEQALANSGETLENFEKNNQERAEKVVKYNLIINKLAKVENIDVTQEEIDEEFNKMAAMYGMTKDKLIEELNKANLFQNYLNQVGGSIFVAKVKKFLVENN